MTFVRGVDISSHQTATSWSQLAKAVGFVVVKATEGQGFVSPTWATYFRQAKAAGILVGSYHFAGSSTTRKLGDAKAEARHYVAQLRSVGWKSGRDLPPVLDIEVHDRSAAGLTAWCRTFLAEVDTSLGLTSGWRRCGIYCNRDYYRTRLDGASIHQGRWLWLASWPNRTGPWPADESAKPAGAAIWQWTDAAKVAGIRENTDGDVAVVADLRNLAPDYYGTTPAPTTPTTTKDADMQQTDLIRLPPWQLQQWPADPGIVDGTIAVSTALGSGYGHSRLAQERTAQILAELGALRGTVDALAAALAALGSGGIHIDTPALVAAVRQASEDGAKAAFTHAHWTADLTLGEEPTP